MTARRITARSEATDIVLGIVGTAVVVGVAVAAVRSPVVGAFTLGCVVGLAAAVLLIRVGWLRRVLEVKGWLDEEVTSLKRANYMAAKELQDSAEHGVIVLPTVSAPADQLPPSAALIGRTRAVDR